MRRGSDRLKRANFRSHQALGAIAETHKQAFAWVELGNSVAAERFHMDKNIFGSIAARQKAETPRPIEPFDDRDFESADRRDLNMRTGGRQFTRMLSSRFIHGKNAENLEALGSHRGLANNTRTFARRLKTILAEDCDVKKHIRGAIIGDDEAIAFGHIEPFDVSGQLDKIERV